MASDSKCSWSLWHFCDLEKSFKIAVKDATLNELTRIMKYTNCQVKLGMSNQVESNYHKCRIKSFWKKTL